MNDFAKAVYAQSCATVSVLFDRRRYGKSRGSETQIQPTGSAEKAHALHERSSAERESVSSGKIDRRLTRMIAKKQKGPAIARGAFSS
jgi:hypothetical protein